MKEMCSHMENVGIDLTFEGSHMGESIGENLFNREKIAVLLDFNEKW
jgi:hypothetical protein